MIGIDIEQFIRDPYGTGIQRVLQYLAREWPEDAPAHFLAPDPERDGVYYQLDPAAAAALISIPFSGYPHQADLRQLVHDELGRLVAPKIPSVDIPDLYSSWLLPEVSYLPSVLERFESLRGFLRTSMIGYDTLPMTEPANYRFKPGSSAWVSEYFRMLAIADSVACISAYSRDSILGRLRRDPDKLTTVAHPGGDHIPVRKGEPPERLRLCRVGTMEQRKKPLEILDAFTAAVDSGLEADLLFVGRRSASNQRINDRIDRSIATGYPVTWVEGASDAEVIDLINTSTIFLSLGIEGYGIPVLESIRVGTPVWFDGEQPAAQLMEGRGAFRIDAGSDEGLADWFSRLPDSSHTFDGALDPLGVPRWCDYAQAIAHVVADA